MTWQPVNRPSTSGPITGYAVYADGKKVTDIDSPTGDHALIDISKLIGLNPRAVTIRTKSRDSQSNDSNPIMIPSEYSLKSYTHIFITDSLTTLCRSVGFSLCKYKIGFMFISFETMLTPLFLLQFQ